MAMHRPLPPADCADLPGGYADREALARELRLRFPTAAKLDGGLSPIRGGRRAAERQLLALDPVRYGRSRNFLDGAVTGLSPYVRHGVLGLAEFKRNLLTRLRHWNDGAKLISELAWRDFWQRVWLQRGDAISLDLEPLKTGHDPSAYAPELPADLTAAATGLACIDTFSRQLLSIGWLHNHARMWLAAYVVHWRRCSWQAGARWFLQHLLDGDPASNNLSWQWVASSFSAKPYIFNRENLEKYAGDRFCGGCAAAAQCPFDASYEQLAAQLFNNATTIPANTITASTSTTSAAPPPLGATTVNPQQPLLWIHAEGLGPANPVWQAWPEAPALFVFDQARIAADGTGLKRLGFVAESLLELPVVVRQGDPLQELLAFAQRCGCDGVVSQEPLDPHLRRICAALQQQMPLQLLPAPAFVDLPNTASLQRFNRYWKQAEPLLRKQFSGAC